MKPYLDDLDRLLLGYLLQNSRRSISELASLCSSSRATIRQRLSELSRNQIIKRFTIDLGSPLGDLNSENSAFIHLKLKRPVIKSMFLRVSSWPELVGCWSTTGDVDMVLLLRANGGEEIERLREIIYRDPEVMDVKIISVLRTVR